jgi:hypothetical protein
MTLVLRIPDPVEYPLDLTATSAGELVFKIRDPKTGAPVTRFEVMHEKLFHMFIVSQDLSFFVHDHPEPAGPGAFRYHAVLPKPGMYRVLADYYPANGTPQLPPRTIFVPGGDLRTPVLEPDLAPKHAANLDVELITEPRQPIAGAPPETEATCLTSRPSSPRLTPRESRRASRFMAR